MTDKNEMDALVELAVSACVAEGGQWNVCPIGMRAALIAIDLPKLLADAGRYRWLRDPERLSEAADGSGLFVGVESAKIWGLSVDEADAAIDAAMQAEGK